MPYYTYCMVPNTDNYDESTNENKGGDNYVNCPCCGDEFFNLPRPFNVIYFVFSGYNKEKNKLDFIHRFMVKEIKKLSKDDKLPYFTYLIRKREWHEHK